MTLLRYTLYAHQAAGAQFLAPRGWANLSDGIHVILAVVAAPPLHEPSAGTGPRESEFQGPEELLPSELRSRRSPAMHFPPEFAHRGNEHVPEQEK